MSRTLHVKIDRAERRARVIRKTERRKTTRTAVVLAELALEV